MDKSRQLDLAVAQLTGWHHAKSHGFRITDLIESMGLTYSEWAEIAKDVQWLSTDDKVEIEQYLIRKRADALPF